MNGGKQIMLNFRIYRNVWREKNHAQFPNIQKCIEEKKLCPISVYTEMNGGKNIIPNFRIYRNVWR